MSNREDTMYLIIGLASYIFLEHYDDSKCISYLSKCIYIQTILLAEEYLS